MQHAGLRADHQDVVSLLLIGKDLFGQLGALGLAQVVSVQAADDAVGEAALGGQNREHHLDSLVVGGGQRLPAGDGKPRLGALAAAACGLASHGSCRGWERACATR